MGSFRFPLSSAGSLHEAFEGIPRGAKAFLKKGFGIIAGIPEDKYRQLMEAVIRSADWPRLSVEKDLHIKMGVKEKEASPLMAAASLVIFELSSGEGSVEETLGAAMAAEVIEKTHSSAVRKFAQAVELDRTELKNAFKKSSLASAVLPSLDDFDMVVDVRVGFEKGHARYTVPVVIAHIDTDIPQKELWVQISKRQVETLIKDLRDTLRRVEEVEKIVFPFQK